jgi:hypothetical protein
MITPVAAQTVNNTTVTMIGANQNVIVNQSASVSLSGDGLSVSATQSGTTPKTFSLDVTCFANCPTSPYVINQY